MLKISTWNRNGLFMSLLEVSTRKPIMVFYYKTTKGFVSRTVWENRLRFNFENFITFSVDILLNYDMRKNWKLWQASIFTLPRKTSFWRFSWSGEFWKDLYDVLLWQNVKVRVSYLHQHSTMYLPITEIN